MRAVVLAKGHDLEFVESTGAVCTMRARRRGGDNWTTVSWSIDAARQAGLANKNVWKAYPRVMLQARCTTEICRMVFPDVIHGFRSLEELQDLEGLDTDAGDAPAAVPSTSTVARKRATRKAAAALPAAPPPPPVAGPPLPGEDGYDDPTPQTTEAPTETTEPTPTPEPAASPAADTEAGPAEGEGEAPDAVPAEVTLPPQRAMTKPQSRMLFARLSELGVDNDDREERLAILSGVLGREITSSNDLTREDAQGLLDGLAGLTDRAALYALLDELDAARAQGVDGVQS
jgi:hypothetical protein